MIRLPLEIRKIKHREVKQPAPITQLRRGKAERHSKTPANSLTLDKEEAEPAHTICVPNTTTLLYEKHG